MFTKRQPMVDDFFLLTGALHCPPPLDVAHTSYYFKVLTIGDSGVGKSCLQTRYTAGTFTERYIFTIGVEFMTKIIPLDGSLVKLQLWDTAGQERFRAITRSFYRGACGVILVYDVTNQKSFESIRGWIETVDNWTYEAVSKILIGNKCDLTSERVVDYNTAKAFADELGIPLIETSAKDTTNVEQAFVQLAADMKRRADLSKTPASKVRVKISSQTTQDKRCC